MRELETVKRLGLFLLIAILTRPAEGLAGGQSRAPEVAQPAAGDVEAVLDRVEARGQSIRDIRCTVVYTVEDRIAADMVTRYGEIIYRM